MPRLASARLVRWAAAAPLAAALLAAPAAFAATIWTFDLPATALASQSPPYPTVATLTLTQTADGVQFVLDPNQGSPGFADGSFVERLDFVYGGADLTASDFRLDAGAPGAFQFESNPNNMDAGYHSDAFHIVVDFPSKNDPDRFVPTDTSTWTVLGASLADFTGSSASSNGKPSPIYAVLSVTAYSLPGVTPTPSNWVAQVPEPGLGVLLGLAALSALGRRRRPHR